MDRNLPDGMDPAELDESWGDGDDFEEPYEELLDSTQAERAYEDKLFAGGER